MKRRLKIYFIHSSRYDYNNLLYKDILSSPILNKHELMLPLTKTYKEKYAKDLINKADLVVAEVSTPSFGLKLELKWLSQVEKPKLFFSLNNNLPKSLKKYVKEISFTNNDITFIKLIEDFVQKYDQMTEEEANDPVINLGQLN
ncbi:MAG: hypothetical protein Q4C44_01120 [bacterium]|nr:hypothetical protein [bacterium]